MEDATESPGEQKKKKPSFFDKARDKYDSAKRKYIDENDDVQDAIKEGQTYVTEVKKDYGEVKKSAGEVKESVVQIKQALKEREERKREEQHSKIQNQIRERQDRIRLKQLSYQEQKLAARTTEQNPLKAMLSPKPNVGGNPQMFGNTGNSVMLNLLTGKGQEARPRKHYVTVIDRGTARRVEAGQYAQPTPQAPPAPGNSLLDRMTLGNPSLLNQPAGKPAFDYALTGNSLRDRMKLSNAKYGYSFATKKKMRYL
ncbi:MAG: hypothetical protein PHS46_08630 [Candidatus Omnitrophica bacterium]|nr:hypothetical protein [Candidatus Omnitrophota bacterium]